MSCQSNRDYKSPCTSSFVCELKQRGTSSPREILWKIPRFAGCWKQQNTKDCKGTHIPLSPISQPYCDSVDTYDITEVQNKVYCYYFNNFQNFLFTGETYVRKGVREQEWAAKAFRPWYGYVPDKGEGGKRRRRLEELQITMQLWETLSISTESPMIKIIHRGDITLGRNAYSLAEGAGESFLRKLSLIQMSTANLESWRHWC